MKYYECHVTMEGDPKIIRVAVEKSSVEIFRNLWRHRAWRGQEMLCDPAVQCKVR